MDFGSLIHALTSILQGGNSQSNPQPNVIGNPSQMKLTTKVLPGAVSNSQPTYSQPTPQPSTPPITTSNNTGFKFQMGQHDYSGLRGQIQRVLQNSPLAQYADNFIQAGNAHGVDPRVLVTIANNESSLGRHYPHPGDPAYANVSNMQDTYNPFGYLVNPTTGHGIEDVYNGARNAGFTSIPHAIEALTNRFATNQFPNYQKFRQDPTIDNLQQAYNANPSERDNYLRNASALTSQFQ